MKFLALLLFASIVTLSLGACLLRTEDDWYKIRLICYSLLRTSPEVRERVNQKLYNDDPETNCLIRCGGIISGIYNDKTNDWRPSWPREVISSKEYKTAYWECAAGVTPEVYGDDYCKKAYLLFLCSWGAWGKQ